MGILVALYFFELDLSARKKGAQFSLGGMRHPEKLSYGSNFAVFFIDRFKVGSVATYQYQE